MVRIKNQIEPIKGRCGFVGSRFQFLKPRNQTDCYIINYLLSLAHQVNAPLKPTRPLLFHFLYVNFTFLSFQIENKFNILYSNYVYIQFIISGCA
jgi:hypothetical protein